MKQKIQLSILFCMFSLAVAAQKDTSATVNHSKKDLSTKVDSVKKDKSAARKLGDLAPPLRVREWIKDDYSRQICSGLSNLACISRNSSICLNQTPVSVTRPKPRPFHFATQ